MQGLLNHCMFIQQLWWGIPCLNLTHQFDIGLVYMHQVQKKSINFDFENHAEALILIGCYLLSNSKMRRLEKWRNVITQLLRPEMVFGIDHKLSSNPRDYFSSIFLTFIPPVKGNLKSPKISIINKFEKPYKYNLILPSIFLVRIYIFSTRYLWKKGFSKL